MIPAKDYNFTIQMYDRDFFKSNEIIGETQINLQQIMEDCSLVKEQLTLNETYYEDVLKPRKFQKLHFDSAINDSFWLDMKAKDSNGRLEKNGRVRIRIDVLPIVKAEKNSVGKARNDPNHSPYLPAPQGRVELTIDPFKMYSQLLGPEIRRRINDSLCKIICVLVCVFLIIPISPQIFIIMTNLLATASSVK